MCCIAGYQVGRSSAGAVEAVAAALNAMAHRGPDDAGLSLIQASPQQSRHVCLPTEASLTPGTPRRSAGLDVQAARSFEHNICFGHRRFALVDLSTGGHQPYWTPGGEVCVAFNGEIYNYVELRQELVAKGHPFQTQSDTEVLARSYLQWGERCFERLVVFFALSLYDSRRGAMMLARDRIGEAPCYATQSGSNLYWASEVNGLLAMRGRSAFTVNERAILDFVKYQRRDIHDKTCFREIQTFPPAAFRGFPLVASCPRGGIGRRPRLA